MSLKGLDRGQVTHVMAWGNYAERIPTETEHDGLIVVTHDPQASPDGPRQGEFPLQALESAGVRVPSGARSSLRGTIPCPSSRGSE
jgi:hypothetical protein